VSGNLRTFLIILNRQKLFCCGNNSQGMLGLNNSKDSKIFKFTEVPLDPKIKKIL